MNTRKTSEVISVDFTREEGFLLSNVIFSMTEQAERDLETNPEYATYAKESKELINQLRALCVRIGSKLEE